MNNRNENTSMEWLNDRFPKDDCPYCGENYNISFYRDDDGMDVFYRATCNRCGKSWGQAFHLEFDCNFED